jgi:hypothetical protein
MYRNAPLSRTLTRLGIGLLVAGTVAELAVLWKWRDVRNDQNALRAELDVAVKKTRGRLGAGEKLERYDNGEYWIVSREHYADGVTAIHSFGAIELSRKSKETDLLVNELESSRVLLEPFVKLLAAPIIAGIVLIALFGRLPRPAAPSDPVVAAPPVEPPPADE